MQSSTVQSGAGEGIIAFKLFFISCNESHEYIIFGARRFPNKKSRDAPVWSFQDEDVCASQEKRTVKTFQNPTMRYCTIHVDRWKMVKSCFVALRVSSLSLVFVSLFRKSLWLTQGSTNGCRTTCTLHTYLCRLRLTYLFPLHSRAHERLFLCPILYVLALFAGPAEDARSVCVSLCAMRIANNEYLQPATHKHIEEHKIRFTLWNNYYPSA